MSLIASIIKQKCEYVQKCIEIENLLYSHWQAHGKPYLVVTETRIGQKSKNINIIAITSWILDGLPGCKCENKLLHQHNLLHYHSLNGSISTYTNIIDNYEGDIVEEKEFRTKKLRKLLLLNT